MTSLNQLLQHDFLQNTFLNNTLADYLESLGLLVLLVIIFKLLNYLVIARLKALAAKTENDVDDILIQIIGTLKPSFYWFLAFYLSVRNLNINPLALKIIGYILLIWIVYQIITALNILVGYLIQRWVKREDDSNTKSAFLTIRKIISAILWVVGLLFLLSNFGVNITSVIATLGIGGVAIALALQNILTDLFSSFALYFDKPFVIGDFIVVGDKQGVVEHIGIKTTRIRALQGEQLVISNQELTSAQIQNFKKLSERRVVFAFGVTYDTSDEKLQAIPSLVKQAFSGIDKVRLDRVHFNKFGDWSLDFEVVYFVLSPEYLDFMDANQKILFKIKSVLEKNKIEFAFPTQTILVDKN